MTEANDAAGVIEGTDAAGITEGTEAAGVTEGTEARGTVTEAADAEGARGAGGCTMACADADALRRSNSMKCV